MNELKPCPFCGGRAHMTELNKIAAFRYIVCCVNRDCIAYRLSSAYTPRYYTEEEATEKWNRRMKNENKT